MSDRDILQRDSEAARNLTASPPHCHHRQPKLAFQAALLIGGEIRNVGFAIVPQRDWLKIAVLSTTNGMTREIASLCCHELNALLFRGFPLRLLAQAAAESNSNHAEIARCAWETLQAANASLQSAGQEEIAA